MKIIMQYVKLSRGLTNSFKSSLGARQGYSWSPILCNMYINNLISYNVILYQWPNWRIFHHLIIYVFRVNEICVLGTVKFIPMTS